GDAARLARRLADRLDGEARVHERFGTATVRWPGGTLDVAATRRESYERSGALPVVRTGVSVAEDLARRDFTINAIALELGPGRRRHDPFGGLGDLRRGVVRELHPASFLEDPTRIFRAARYAHRLRFRIAPLTRRRIREALAGGALDRISADRLRREIVLLLEEARPAEAVRRLDVLGVSRAVAPALERRTGASARLRRLERLGSSSGRATGWFGLLLAWLGPASADEAASVAMRLGLAGDLARRLSGWPALVAAFPRDLARLPLSERRRAAARLGPEEILALAVLLPPRDAAALVAAAAPEPAPLLSIGGRDLVAAGVAPGPAVGRALERTRAALEDGRIGAADQLAFALRAAREDSR
ncbi:MAG: hypothetical protein ACM3NW_03250, partial [Syntrophomonadaceae bacterium]